MIRCLSFTLALLLCVTPLTAQQDEQLRARFDAAGYREIAGLLDSARALGLPAGPLASKALEGAAKRAPVPMILAAMRNLTRQLSEAQGELGRSAGAGELEAGAIALRAGVPRDGLARLRAAAPATDLTVALTVATDLTAHGVPPAEAAAAVETVARRGGRDPAFEALRSRVIYDVGRGLAPGTSAAQRARTLDIPRSAP